MRRPASAGSATLFLCDHATVADGKLYIAGAGWSIVSPNVTVT